MTVETLALILGFLSVLTTLTLGGLAIFLQFYISKMTNKMIEKEDERAKMMIDEGNKRLEEILKETQRMIDEGNKRLEIILSEILKKV